MSEELEQWLLANGYNQNDISTFPNTEIALYQSLLDSGDLTLESIQRDPSTPQTGEPPNDATVPEPSTFEAQAGTGATFIPSLLAPQLKSLGLVADDGQKWNPGKAAEFYGFLNEHSKEAGGEGFKDDETGIAEALQYLGELGVAGRDEFMTSNYVVAEDTLAITMPNGKQKVLRAAEMQAINTFTGQSKGDIGKAVWAGARTGTDFRLTLMAQGERERAGLGGTMSQTSAMVAEGLKKFNSNKELAYLFASEMPLDMNPAGDAATSASTSLTIAEKIFKGESITEKEMNWKDERFQSYKKLAESGNSFSSNEESLNYLINLGYESRTPEVAISEGTARETFRNLYQSLFLTVPDDETLDAFQQQFEGDISSWSKRQAARNVPWSEKGQMTGDMYGAPTADDSAMGFIQDTDIYSDLYNDEFRRSGLTEEQYAARFGNYALGSFQSPSLVTDAAQAGMRTGNLSTVDSFASTKRGMADPNVKAGFMRAIELMRGQ